MKKDQASFEDIMDNVNKMADAALSQYDKFEIKIWNAAIDAAAKECEAWDKGSSPKADIAPEIRKLKR